MRRAFFFLVAAVLFACGCVSERRGGVKDDVAPWRIGVTRMRDVVAAWGNPDFVQGDLWVWWNSDSLGGKFRAAYMQIGVTVSNAQRSMREYRLRFGPDGTLASIDAVESIPGGARWSLNPF